MRIQRNRGNGYQWLGCAAVLLFSIPAPCQTVVTTPEELVAAVSVPENTIYVGADLEFDGLGSTNQIPYISGHGITLESDPSGPTRVITLLDSAKFMGILADNVTIRNLSFVAEDTFISPGEEPYQPGFFIALFGNDQSQNADGNPREWNSPDGDPLMIENVLIEDCVFTGFGGTAVPGALVRIDQDAASVTFKRCFMDYTGGQAVLRFGQFGGQPEKTGRLVIDQCTLVGYPIDHPNQPFVIYLQSLVNSTGDGIEVEISNSILIPGGNVDPEAGFAPFGPVANWAHGDKLLSFEEHHNMIITASGNFGGGNELIEKAPDASDIVNQNPIFVDIENRNFHLQPGSPAIGAGEGGINIGADQSISTSITSWTYY